MSVTHQIIAPAVSAADRDCDRNHDEILLFPSSSKLFQSYFPSSLPHPPPRVTHYRSSISILSLSRHVVHSLHVGNHRTSHSRPWCAAGPKSRVAPVGL